ncbi:MAG: hypothetical protein KatS3mg108_1122 [Isosphaeraceae bacterium]|jgi:hypothetical protein|nr:MAG: hypothetical protein KatS3mg108_1122 [Isosphaeraceae bacterium]
MDRRPTIDRFEGPDRQIAVLVEVDGSTREVPRADLPAGAKPGDVLSEDLKAIDHAATAALAQKTQALQAELKARDPGGDLRL